MKFDFLNFFVKGFIAVVFLLIVGWFVSMAYLIITASHVIDKDGVKGIVTQLWCGENKPDCMEKSK